MERAGTSAAAFYCADYRPLRASAASAFRPIPPPRPNKTKADPPPIPAPRKSKNVEPKPIPAPRRRRTTAIVDKEAVQNATTLGGEDADQQNGGLAKQVEWLKLLAKSSPDLSNRGHSAAAEEEEKTTNFGWRRRAERSRVIRRLAVPPPKTEAPPISPKVLHDSYEGQSPDFHVKILSSPSPLRRPSVLGIPAIERRIIKATAARPPTPPQPPQFAHLTLSSPAARPGDASPCSWSRSPRSPATSKDSGHHATSSSGVGGVSLSPRPRGDILPTLDMVESELQEMSRLDEDDILPVGSEESVDSMFTSVTDRKVNSYNEEFETESPLPSLSRPLTVLERHARVVKWIQGCQHRNPSFASTEKPRVRHTTSGPTISTEVVC